MSRAKPTSGFDRSRALLTRLGWDFTSERLPDFIEQGVRDQLTLGAFLETLAETSFREEKRVKMWLKHSRLPVGKTLESFDFLFNRSVEPASSRGDGRRFCCLARRAPGRRIWRRRSASRRSRTASTRCSLTPTT